MIIQEINPLEMASLHVVYDNLSPLDEADGKHGSTELPIQRVRVATVSREIEMRIARSLFEQYKYPERFPNFKRLMAFCDGNNLRMAFYDEPPYLGIVQIRKLCPGKTFELV
ncbi:hypothetical protein [uncultured Fibrobacter sp.]|uniref:hypothetical protein n=1 Tax=uncultured Fibrobacter sp. TaxID=261512 RepID=UPI0025D5299E|nr:hypothetical protein [uncultured Fibrobacter sp.]